MIRGTHHGSKVGRAGFTGVSLHTRMVTEKISIWARSSFRIPSETSSKFIDKRKGKEMSLRKRLMEAAEKYPQVDVFIRRGILYIGGVPEEEFIEKSLSSSYYLPRAEFSTTYELGEPAELIRKKGMAKVEAMADEKMRKGDRG